MDEQKEPENTKVMKKLTFEKRIQLAKAVKSFPSLWDRNLPGGTTKNKTKLKDIWDKIGEMILENGPECREVWRSMKNSYRYHMKVSKSKNEQDHLPNMATRANEEGYSNWALLEHMKFLDNRQEATSSSAMGTPPTAMLDTNQEIEIDCEDVKVEQIQGFTCQLGYVEGNAPAPYYQMYQEDNSTACKRTVWKKTTHLMVPGTELKYYSMYPNLDRMWKKLPEAVVEDLNLQICQASYHALVKYQQASIITKGAETKSEKSVPNPNPALK